jgi:hypothetical protein
MSCAASPVKVKLHAHPRPTGACVFAQAPAERNMEIFASVHVKEWKFFRSLGISNKVNKIANFEANFIKCMYFIPFLFGYEMTTGKKHIIFNSNNEREREG